MSLLPGEVPVGGRPVIPGGDKVAFQAETALEAGTCAALRLAPLSASGIAYAAKRRRKWNASSTATDDATEGAIAIQKTGTATGRYLIDDLPGTIALTQPDGTSETAASIARSTIVLSPATSGDDWVRLNALIADGQRRFYFQRGVWRAATNISNLLAPPYLHFEFAPGSSLICTHTVRQSPPPSPYNGPFCFGYTVVSSVPLFTAAALVGARQVVVDTAIPVGAYFTASNGNNIYGTYRVDGSSGSGPYTLTLDRRLRRAIASGSLAQVVVPNHNVTLLLNGLQISGTFERAVSIPIAWNCRVDHAEIDASQSNEYVCSFDSGSFNSHFTRMRVTGSITYGIALEYGATQCSASDCTIYGHDWGFLGADCIDSEWYNCWAHGDHADGNGFTMGMYAGGMVGCKIFGGGAEGFGHGISTTGIDAVTGRGDLQLFGFAARYNSVGALISGRTSLHGCTIEGNASGVQVAGSGARAELISCTLIANSQQALISAGAKTYWNGGEITGSAGGFSVIDANSRVVMVGTRIALSAAGWCVDAEAGDISLDDVTFVPTASGGCTLQSAGTVRYGRCEIEGTAATGHSASAGVMWRGLTSFEGATAPFALTGTAQSSSQLLVLNGTNPVYGAFSQITDNSQILASRHQAGGTPGHFACTTDSGNGRVVLTGSSGDTSYVRVVIS
jgi:hypothetical protein